MSRRRRTAAAVAIPAAFEAPRAAPLVSGQLAVRASIICLLAGVAVAFSFAPFELFPLAWVGVAVLFATWERASLRQCVLTGFAFGVGLFTAGGYWVLPGLLRHGGYAVPAAVAACAAMVALCAAHIALAGCARAIGGARARALRLFTVMPGAFVLCEFLRTYTLTGFPWLSLGYGQIDGPLGGLAPIGGVHLISLACAIIAGALAFAWLERARWKLAAASVVAILLIGWGAGMPTWTQPQGRALEIAAIQGNVRSDIKWTPEQLQPTLDLYADATMAAMRTHRLDAVIWPETAITARPDQVRPYLANMKQAVTPAGTTVVFGIIDVEGTGAAARYFNAALATGSAEGAYRKRHLVPLTEYLPAFVPSAWREELKREAVGIFSPGAEAQPPIRIAQVPARTMICYETAYGWLVRDASGAAGLLLSLSNDDWFMGTTMPALDQQVARLRALESGREMLRVANSGVTAWIGADGRVVSQLPVQERATLFARVQPRSGLTPYWRWGEWTWIALLAAGIVIAVTATMLASDRRRASAF